MAYRCEDDEASENAVDGTIGRANACGRGYCMHNYDRRDPKIYSELAFFFVATTSRYF